MQEIIEFCRVREADEPFLLLDPAFSVSLPRRLAQKIEPGNIYDPIFRQFVPFRDEAVPVGGFLCDPLCESTARPCSNLLHKYFGRALLIAASGCGMHCRFCLRQHFPYASRDSFSEELVYLQSHQEIDEVILSGGDPLALPTYALMDLLTRLEAIPHIRRIRIHTRFPIGIPERIDEELLRGFSAIAKPIVVSLHVNHPKELDDDVRSSLQRLRSIGAMLLSQTVLLKGINDSVHVLSWLMSALVQAGILPYYLHQLDRVEGAHRFEVPIHEGLVLMETLRATLPGYMVPRYVQERHGEPGKTILTFSQEPECQEIQALSGESCL